MCLQKVRELFELLPNVKFIWHAPHDYDFMSTLFTISGGEKKTEKNETKVHRVPTCWLFDNNIHRYSSRGQFFAVSSQMDTQCPSAGHVIRRRSTWMH